jgi:DNA-binding PadR family transcriptional regulator
MEDHEITYHAVEKDGVVTAIWEMQGRKHLRTIDPRSEEGRRILGAYTTEEIEHAQAADTSEAAQ